MIIRPIWDQDRKIEGMERNTVYEKYCPFGSELYEVVPAITSEYTITFEYIMVLENEARENIEKDKVKTK